MRPFKQYVMKDCFSHFQSFCGQARSALELSAHQRLRGVRRVVHPAGPWPCLRCLPGMSPSSSRVQAATAALTPGSVSGKVLLLPRSPSAVPLHTLRGGPSSCPFGHPPPPRQGQSHDDLFLQRGLLCPGHASVPCTTRVFFHCHPLKWLVVWVSYNKFSHSSR